MQPATPAVRVDRAVLERRRRCANANHACAAANLHPALHIVSGGAIVDRWDVAARGWA